MKLVKQFVRFTGAGAIGTMGHYAVLISAVQWLKIDPVIATVLGSITGALINYFLNYYFTFQSSKRHRYAAPKFFSVALTGMGLNALLMWAIVPYTHYLIAQLCATGTVLIWNFLINRIWTFRVKTA